MAVDEGSRLELHRQLEKVLGSRAAMTLIEYLPPGGGANVATKGDLDAFEQRFSVRLDNLGHRIDRLEQRMDRLELRMDRLEQRMDDLQAVVASQTRTFVIGMIGAAATSGSLVLAAVRFG